MKMTVLQQEAQQIIQELPDERLSVLVDFMRTFVAGAHDTPRPKQQRIGIARDMDLYDRDYDFDELNPTIAAMFGVA